MQIIDLLLRILPLTTNIRGSFVEYMFKNSQYVIVCDEVLEVFVGWGCCRTKYVIGDGLRKC